jgi:serpin B
MQHAVVMMLATALAASAGLASGCAKAKDAAPAPTNPTNPATPADPSAPPARPATQPATSEPSANVPPTPSATVADPSKMTVAAQGDRGFAAALHGALQKTEKGNLFFSPASVRLAMAMTAAGARGETAAELSKGLSLPADPAASAAGFAAILESFAQRATPVETPQMEEWQRAEAARKVATVAIANRVWPQQGRPFEKSFTELMAKGFAAPLEPLDFEKATEPARKRINAWVSEQTQGKIPELLLPSNVRADTKMILTNAIYFKAQWEIPFTESATIDGPFTTAAGAKVKTKMMRRTAPMMYAETPAYQVVQLPYSDGSLSLTVVLPREGMSLAEVEPSLLASSAPALASQRVELQLPRFKIESRFGLAQVLAKLGMPSAFAFGKADFSGIDGTRELFIGDVVHQAVIEVDEQGTVAAAATAVTMRAGSARPPADPPKRFIADRPFAFFIQDARTGVVLFVGRLATPTAK